MSSLQQPKLSQSETSSPSEPLSGTENPPCPACGNQEIPPPRYFEACRLTEGEVLGLSVCPECSIYFTRPRLERHNLATREADYDYIVTKYQGEARSGRFHKNRNYRHYLQLAEDRLAQSKPAPYSVLDVGSHCGFFVRFAREQGWNARGIEPSPPCVRFAREVNDVDTVEHGLFDESYDAERRFDLITMWDVLEHIPNPIRLLTLANAHLNPGGLVMCKVPHIQFYLTWWPLVSWLTKLHVLPHFPTFDEPPPKGGRDGVGGGFFDLFEHVVHYDRNAASAIFGKAGFADLELLPAPPTNPARHYLNLPRSLTFRLARVLHAVGGEPGALTHGLVMIARRGD